MDDLIKALKIFRKYRNDKWPTNCAHDTLMVNVSCDDVSDEDIKELSDLGFEANEHNTFSSFRFGSC